MASITPMSFFTPDATINPDEYTFEIVDAAARKHIIGPADTYADFYNAVAATSTGIPFIFTTSGTVSLVLNPDELQTSIKGVGVKTQGDPVVADLMFMTGLGDIFAGRYTLAENSATRTLISRGAAKAKFITSAFDMNDITTPGSYRAATAVTNITNWPHADGWLFFSVYGALSSQGTYSNVVQVVFGGRTAGIAQRKMYVRYMTDGTWGSWVAYSADADVLKDVRMVGVPYTGTFTATVPANGTVEIDLPVTLPTGYQFVGRGDVWASDSQVIVGNRYMTTENTKIHVVLRNLSTTQKTPYVYAVVIAKKY